MSGAASEIDLEALCRDMRRPSDDEVPTALDGSPLDTKEKLLSYLAGINERRDGERVD